MTTTVLSPRLLEVRGEVRLGDPLTLGTPLLDLARLPDGRILVLRDGAGVNPDGSGIGAFLLDDTGALIAGSGFGVSQFAGGAQSHPDVALLAGGGFVATWTAQDQDGFEGGIYGRIFNADLTPRGAEFQISDDAPLSQDQAHVRALPGGGFVVGWQADTVRVQYFDATGQAEGDPFTLAGTLRVSRFEDLWVDAAGQVIVLTRTTGGQIGDGLSQWVLTGPSGPVPQRQFLDLNPAPSGNFNDMTVEIFDLGPDLALSRHYSAAGALFRPSFLMVSLLDSTAPGFLRDVLPGQQNLSFDLLMGQTYLSAIDAGFALLGNGNLLALYGNSQDFPAADWQLAVSEYRINHVAMGAVLFQGAGVSGEVLTADLSGLADADGLGPFSLQWRLDGTDIPGATFASLNVTGAMIGQRLSLMIRWTDGAGNPETVLATVDGPVQEASRVLTGTAGPDNLLGAGADDLLSGLGGDDLLLGYGGNDTLRGGDGADRLNAGEGNDRIYGGETAADLRDVVFAGAGDDSAFGGHGNDLLYGDTGNDLLSGDFGADELLGQAGNDTLAGGQGSDLLYGGDGIDFLNGGFGHDRLNGGAGADSFLHLGLPDHGSDWIQDYSAAQGDRLVFGDDLALPGQFQVNYAFTPGAGAADVAEAFVIYRPTGQILWALVDGAAQGQIFLSIDGEVHGLL